MGLSVFSLITKNFEYIPYLMLSLGATMLVAGLIELQKSSKEFWGYFSIVASLFVFYVAIQGLFLH